MMVTNVLICVLAFFEVYGGLQGQRLVDNKPKLPDHTPKSRKRNFDASYIAETSSISVYLLI